MTVAELIAKLSEYPGDMPVYVDGYEGGYDIPAVKVVNISPEPKGYESYCGQYDEAPNAPESVVVSHCP